MTINEVTQHLHPWSYKQLETLTHQDEISLSLQTPQHSSLFSGFAIMVNTLTIFMGRTEGHCLHYLNNSHQMRHHARLSEPAAPCPKLYVRVLLWKSHKNSIAVWMLKRLTWFLFQYVELNTEFHHGRTCTKIKPAVTTHLPVYGHPWGKSLRILPKLHHFLPLHRTESGCHLQMVTFRHVTAMAVIMLTSLLANAASTSLYLM